MHYTLRIAGRDIPVEANVTEEGALDAVVDGRSILARYRVVSPNQIHLEIDGASVNAYVADDHEGKLINVQGMTYGVQDADVLAQAGPRRRGLADLPQEITPPMPAVVVRILVAEGDIVEKGQGVIVVSAMKMETTLRAPFNGKVLKINVADGEKVMPGQILVDIERQEASPEQPPEG
jgi:3-methylcrotonyl-CoA carboxylase alpha subunit